MVQLRQQAVAKRKENKNAVALDCEQVDIWLSCVGGAGDGDGDDGDDAYPLILFPLQCHDSSNFA